MKALCFAIALLAGQWLFSFNEYNLISHFDVDSGLPSNFVYSLAQDRDGVIWMGTLHGLVRYNGSTFKTFNDETTDIENDDVFRIEFDDQNHLNVYTARGVYRFENNSFHKLSDKVPSYSLNIYENKQTHLKERFFKNTEVPTNGVFDILEDYEKNIWISSNEGVFLYSRKPFRNLTGLNNIHSVCVLDNLFFIATADGLYEFKNKDLNRLFKGSFKSFSEQNGKIYTISLPDIYCYEKGKWEKVLRLKKDYGPATVARETVHGTLLVGANYLLEVKQENIKAYTVPGLNNFKIRDIEKYDENTYLIGTSHGVFQFDGEEFSKNTLWDTSGFVFDIYLDDNDIWVASDAGLTWINRITGDRVHKTVKEGLNSNEIYCLIDDGRGFLWGSDDKGVFRIDKKLFRQGIVSVSIFGKKDGLIETTMIGSYDHVADFDNSTIYFCTKNSVSAIDLNHIPVNSVPPGVIVESVSVDSRAMNAQNLTLAPEQKRIEFEYAGLSYKYPEGVQYKYRLDGYEDIWNTTADRKTSYNNLSPGDYTFEVMASNADGVWSTLPASVSFTVLRPFYMTWWFYSLAVIVIYALLSYLFKGFRYLVHSVTFLRQSTFIGPHKVLETVGSGGMGTVYKAKNIETSDIVAIKVLHENISDERTRTRFLNEGIICEQVQHPNVIRMYDRGEDRGRLYYAMEFVEGVTLRRLINEKQLCVNCALAITSLLSEIIHSIHSYGIVHRDIKPDNLMVGRGMDTVRDLSVDEMILKLRGKLTLLDFGLAKMLGNTALTQTGLLAGTVYYLPPEAMEARKDWYPEIDFYSMGIMLYEMLMYTNPFEGNDMLAVVYKVMNQVPPAPSKVNPEIPEAVSDFTMRLIEKDPERRLSDYHAIRKALDTLI